jgi:hypothetical protein
MCRALIDGMRLQLHAPSWHEFFGCWCICDYRFMPDLGETCARVLLSSFNPQMEPNLFLVLRKGKSDDLESFCDCRSDSRGEQDALYPIRKDIRRAYRSDKKTQSVSPIRSNNAVRKSRVRNDKEFQIEEKLIRPNLALLHYSRRLCRYSVDIGEKDNVGVIKGDNRR